MYIHTLPTTGSISFSDLFLSSSSLAPRLADATTSRARLRSILKLNRKLPSAGGASSGTGAPTGMGPATDGKGEENEEGMGVLQRDWSKIVLAVDDYLPHLLGIYNCLLTDDLLLRHEPEFSWRTTLTPSLLRPPPRITLRGIHYELTFTLLLSGMSLYNLSSSLAHSLGPYEKDLKLSNQERKTRDERLRFAADNLCKAAGVFGYLSDVVIPRWEETGGSAVMGRPADVTKEVTRALSNLAMAEAETLAIRKLLSPALSAASDTITPGPPLSSSHPSASLLAKLHLNVSSLYDSAHSMACTVSSKVSVPRLDQEMAVELDAGRSAIGDDDDGAQGSGIPTSSSSLRKATGRGTFSKLKNLSKGKSTSEGNLGGGGGRGMSTSTGGGEDTQVAGHLLRYLSSSSQLSKAVAYKWLAINEGESKGGYGQAIGFLRMANESLKNLNTKPRSGANALMGKGNPIVKEPWDALRLRRDEELRNVTHWLGAYTKMNDTVSFQPIPNLGTLQSKIPSPRGALCPKVYELPLPSFGPGSPGFTSEGMRRLVGFHDPQHSASSSRPGTGAGPGTGIGAGVRTGTATATGGVGESSEEDGVASLSLDLSSLGLLGPPKMGIDGTGKGTTSFGKGGTYAGSGAYY